jgi:hypothetical protein
MRPAIEKAARDCAPAALGSAHNEFDSTTPALLALMNLTAVLLVAVLLIGWLL